MFVSCIHISCPCNNIINEQWAIMCFSFEGQSNKININQKVSQHIDIMSVLPIRESLLKTFHFLNQTETKPKDKDMGGSVDIRCTTSVELGEGGNTSQKTVLLK